MIVQGMYEGARTRVNVSVGLTDMIPVGVGLHQRSSLSPYLFAMIMDVLVLECTCIATDNACKLFINLIFNTIIYRIYIQYGYL